MNIDIDILCKSLSVACSAERALASADQIPYTCNTKASTRSVDQASVFIALAFELKLHNIFQTKYHSKLTQEFLYYIASIATFVH